MRIIRFRVREARGWVCVCVRVGCWVSGVVVGVVGDRGVGGMDTERKYDLF